MKPLIIVYITAALLVSCGGGKPKEGTINYSGITLEMPLKDSVQATVDTIHMGNMRQGEIIKSGFQLRNTGDRPLVIISIVTGCGCTTSQYDTKPIGVGQERTIGLNFDSKGRYGTQLKTIEIITSDHQVGRIMMLGEVLR